VAARQHGLLTRPIRNVIVLMPPLCTNSDQLTKAVAAIQNAIQEVCGRPAS
jgi:adenosylmethionine-8-amino-7-oxononanoate aminotransferase